MKLLHFHSMGLILSPKRGKPKQIAKDYQGIAVKCV
jgi:hypothetical protein